MRQQVKKATMTDAVIAQVKALAKKDGMTSNFKLWNRKKKPLILPPAN